MWRPRAARPAKSLWKPRHWNQVLPSLGGWSRSCRARRAEGCSGTCRLAGAAVEAGAAAEAAVRAAEAQAAGAEAVAAAGPEASSER